MTAASIEAAVVAHRFPPSRWTICNRVSWGFMGLPYEADLMAVSKSGDLHEIEIKISAADFRVDANKRKWVLPPRIDFFWFGIPAELEHLAALRCAVIGAGLLVWTPPTPEDATSRSAWPISKGGIRVAMKPIRRRPRDRDPQKTAERRAELARLIGLRYWSLRCGIMSWR